jgi:hypothetical protein
MAKIQRRDGEQWQMIITAQEQSGIAAKAYCEKKGIGLASFYAWRKRLTGGTGPARKKRDREFIELNQTGLTEPTPRESPAFEAVLDFGEGISITLRRS